MEIKGVNYKNKHYTLYAKYVRNWLQLFNVKYKMWKKLRNEELKAMSNQWMLIQIMQKKPTQSKQ